MTSNAINVLILAAGKGSRMRSDLPKVLHKVGNLSMIGHTIKTAQKLSPASISVVLSETSNDIEAECLKHDPTIQFFYQKEPLGTAHAVLAAEELIASLDGNLIILYADTPLISVDTLKMIPERLQHHDLVVVGMKPLDCRKYGRILLKEDGTVDSIIETHNTSSEFINLAERSPICNAGMMAFKPRKILAGLRQIPCFNGEYPLTHILSYCHEKRLSVGLVIADERECHGVNSKAELAQAESNFQSLARENLLESGVTLIDPTTVYISYDTHIESDTVIEPYVYIGPGVIVEKGVTLHSFSYLEGCHIKEQASIGPFARIRPHTSIGSSAKVGNFVELKNTTLALGAKVNHLSYIGDADIGMKTNIGAGTITCNYDGYRKNRTTIGHHVFVGANAALVAPLVIEEGAIIAAGSTITKNVQKDSIASSRSLQKEIPGAALKYHTNKRKEN